ncbi:phosphoethanolamine transferase [Orbaceae bacterium ac157xtp]
MITPLTKKINIVLLLILSLLPLVGFIGFPTTLILREYGLTLLFILSAVCLWNITYLRILSVLLIFIWILNISASLIMLILFDAHINAELATIILSTNQHEILGFMYEYWEFVAVGGLLFILMIWLVSRLAKTIPKKILKSALFIFIAIISYKFCESAFRGRLSIPGFSMIEKIAPYSSLNNVAAFGRAQQELALMTKVNAYQPDYHLNVVDRGIDTYVIVIGESVRRKNVSLYGYDRNTTPTIESERDNLFLFENAIAPAPTTSLSLSSILTIKEAGSDDMYLFGDNIIKLANTAGFHTSWFSRQNAIGQFDSFVTIIAKNAQEKEWLSSGYDEALLPFLDQALQQNRTNKKLIILHTNGSHLSACDRYPESETYFTTGLTDYENCYDNSVRYMDKFLNEVFSRLRDKKAAVLYFSDHGQHRRVKYNGSVDYIHGAVNPYKEAFDVPQFIWFSPKLEKQTRTIGQLESPFSLSDNYYLIADWLGIYQNNQENSHSPLSPYYQPRDKTLVVDTFLNIFDYNQLPSEADK